MIFTGTNWNGINDAWDIFLERHASSLTDREKHEKIHGKTNMQILTALFAAKLSDGEIEKFSVEKEDIYQALCMENDMHLDRQKVYRML